MVAETSAKSSAEGRKHLGVRQNRTPTQRLALVVAAAASDGLSDTCSHATANYNRISDYCCIIFDVHAALHNFCNLCISGICHVCHFFDFVGTHIHIYTQAQCSQYFNNTTTRMMKKLCQNNTMST